MIAPGADFLPRRLALPSRSAGLAAIRAALLAGVGARGGTHRDSLGRPRRRGARGGDRWLRPGRRSTATSAWAARAGGRLGALGPPHRAPAASPAGGGCGGAGGIRLLD